MQIYQMALFVLIFSFTVGIINDLGIVGDYHIHEINKNITATSEADIKELTDVDQSPEIATKGDLLDEAGDVGGLEWLWNSMRVIKNTLGLALGIGNFVDDYIPGPVGDTLKHPINAICLFIYGWGIVQFTRRYGSKGAD